jgi:type 1 glutamine amidotransferase
VARKALIVWGGWDGHSPKQVAEIFDAMLKKEGFEVEVSDTLESFNDAKLKDLSLIVPVWTMGQISPELSAAATKAVRELGVGIAGIHGGMCDAFRSDTEWQFMTGGQWVAHPGNIIEYTVNIGPTKSPITEGISGFRVKSEQYYLHVDPSNKVLATTRFPTPGVDGPHVPNGEFDMPVVWTRYYGKGKVFYSSLGHEVATVTLPEHMEILRRGFNWAAK